MSDPLATDRFFDMAVDMLCLAGTDGYFKVLNPAWEACLGWSVDELQAQPYVKFVHPDDRARTIEEAMGLALGASTVRFQNRFRTKGGGYRWLSWSAAPANVDGIIYAAARDVTDEVLAEHASRELNAEQLSRIHAVLATPSIEPVYQPIVRLQDGVVDAVEALARFTKPPVRPPNLWFVEAESVGLRTELELHALRAALSNLPALPASVSLAANVSPMTLTSRSFSRLIGEVDSSRIIVEVTENAAVEDYDRLHRAIEPLRRRGVTLAIDDAGAGFSSLSHIVHLLPEHIKLDRSLVHGIDSDPVKRALASALRTFADAIGASLVAEGIETEGELRAVEELGVACGQGYLLGRPARINKLGGLLLRGGDDALTAAS